MQKSVEASSPTPDLSASSTAPATEAGGSRSYLGAAIAGGVVVALIVFLLLFQWNWLRGPLAAVMSARLHRPVTIAGDLRVHPWSLTPSASVDRLAIGNPAWAGGGTMARIPRLTVQARLLSLFGGGVVLPLVEADRPDVRLVTDAAGRHNWSFGGGAAQGPTRLPAIEHLVVVGGALRFDDAGRRLSFVGAVTADRRTRTGGVVSIQGRLTRGSADWAGPKLSILVPRLTIEARLPLAGGKLVLPRVEADRPVFDLVRDASGRESWNVTGHDKPLKLPPIGRLIVVDGTLGYQDVPRKLRFQGALSSNEDVGAAGQGTFHLAGKGVLNSAPFTAQVAGGRLVDVDPGRPYPFDARLQAGATHVTLAGTIAHPFDFGRLSGKLHVSGQDLGDLYHLTGLAMPATPPFDLAGGFARAGSSYAFEAIKGRVGESDLAGSLTVDHRRGRPFVAGDITSRRLRLIDLAAVIGGAPKVIAGQPVSPSQRAMSAELRAEHRMLPDMHLAVDRVRGMDATLKFRALSVEAGKLPIRDLSFDLILDHGLLTVDPLALTLPRGRLTGLVRVDARKATPATAVDLRLSDARLENLIGHGSASPAIEGGLYARVKLDGTGDSVRRAAASANGAVTVVVPGGEIRQSLAELLGINATKGLFLLLSKSRKDVPIRCAVADFRADNGILTARRIVLDTGVVLATGAGRIDLRDESLDLRLDGKPKKFRLVRINAPITLKGSLESPKIGVSVGKALPQLAIGAALGVFAAPLAAILPFVNPGLAKNADCAGLMAQAAAGPAPPPAHR